MMHTRVRKSKDALAALTTRELHVIEEALTQLRLHERQIHGNAYDTSTLGQTAADLLYRVRRAAFVARRNEATS